ncbi:MAG: hypothetical protein Q4D62_14380 [Planctomycetia bacterium]|nr:hypothetical protein [Planctomycetia bacterium]
MKRFAFLFFLLPFTGCGDGLITVSGEVTWENQPVEKGIIRFEPFDGLGPSAEANVEKGRYSLRMAKGKKRIRVYSYVEKGRRYPFGKEAGPAIDYKQVIPPEYNDQSTLTTDVQEKMKYDFIQ